MSGRACCTAIFCVCQLSVAGQESAPKSDSVLMVTLGDSMSQVVRTDVIDKATFEAL